jgi:hypothetical protein
MSKTEKSFLDRELVKRADSIVKGYQLKLIPTSGGQFIGTSAELPLVATKAASDRIVEATHEALLGAVLAMLSEGIDPPPPVSARRDIQVNVRVSATEKEIIETAARSSGLRGVSEYLRTAALERARKET